MAISNKLYQDAEYNKLSPEAQEIFRQKKFDDSEDNLDIGYDTLYGTIVNFLYNDIYRIKWMIYDYYESEKIYPSIIHICELLDLSNILNEKYDTNLSKLDENKIFYKLPLDRQEALKNRWTNVLVKEKNINDLTNLLLFFCFL